MRLALAVLALLATTIANAATLTLPSFTITDPPPASSGITCTETTPLPHSPVPVGTVMFSCTVAPSNWTGTLSLPGSPNLTTSAPSGNTFNVLVGPNALPAGTYTPGTVTATP